MKIYTKKNIKNNNNNNFFLEIPHDRNVHCT